MWGIVQKISLESASIKDHSKIGSVQDKINIDEVDKSVTQVRVRGFPEFSKGKQVLVP